MPRRNLRSVLFSTGQVLFAVACRESGLGAATDGPAGRSAAIKPSSISGRPGAISGKPGTISCASFTHAREPREISRACANTASCRGIAHSSAAVSTECTIAAPGARPGSAASAAESPERAIAAPSAPGRPTADPWPFSFLQLLPAAGRPSCQSDASPQHSTVRQDEFIRCLQAWQQQASC